MDAHGGSIAAARNLARGWRDRRLVQVRHEVLQQRVGTHEAPPKLHLGAGDGIDEQRGRERAQTVVCADFGALRVVVCSVCLEEDEAIAQRVLDELVRPRVAVEHMRGEFVILHIGQQPAPLLQRELLGLIKRAVERKVCGRREELLEGGAPRGAATASPGAGRGVLRRVLRPCARLSRATCLACLARALVKWARNRRRSLSWRPASSAHAMKVARAVADVHQPLASHRVRSTHLAPLHGRRDGRLVCL
mmetsp:Transcript_15771/g.49035  ORF Transcript_15771/g.49035 Transcript_15771/m.49035 type:complete len:249 (+) Transcript_15771:493-1239(+)